MKAIIEVDIPDYQISQEVSIYFKDTMMIKGIVQEPKTDILDKIRAIVKEWQDNSWTDNLSYECMVKIAELFTDMRDEI